MTLKSPQPPLAERAGAFVRALGTDLAGLSGAILIVAGIEMIHRPSALIVAGLILIALSVLAARRSE
jgi:hypothetical protein